MGMLQDELSKQFDKPVAKKIIEAVFNDKSLLIENDLDFAIALARMVCVYADTDFDIEYKLFRISREEKADTKKTLISLMMLGQAFQNKQGG